MAVVVVRVGSFTLDPRDGRAVVLFVHEPSQRMLPLWLDDVDAAALAAALSGDQGTSTSTAAFTWAAVQACGGSIDRCEFTGEHGGVLRAVVVVDGAFGPVELPTRASTAATLAALSGAPLVVADALLTLVHARLLDAEARQKRQQDTGVDTPLLQTTSERWNQLLEHLREKIVDERPS